MNIPSYLQQNRFGVFRFRRAVPHALRAVVGKREIVRSLRTREPRQAIQRARIVALQFDAWLERVEQAMASSKKGGVTADREFLSTDFKTKVTFLPDGVVETTTEANSDEIKAMKEAGLSPDQITAVLSGHRHGGNLAASAASGSPLLSAPSAMTLQALIDAYNENRRLKYGVEWEVSKAERPKFNRIVDLVGDIPINQVTRERARELFAQIQSLPANTAKLRGLSTTQLLGAGDGPRLSAKSVNDHMRLYASIFQWAIDEGHLPSGRNLFRGLQVTDKARAKDKRDVFTPEDLKKIFSGPVYTSYGESPYDKPYRYWAPLIGLFTGARTAEVAGLRVEDVCIDVAVPYFNITSYEGTDDGNGKALKKTVKTEHSNRKVPIHPKLLELGLKSFVQGQRKAGADRLFPELSWSKNDGYGRMVGEWFNGTYLPNVRVHVKNRKVFHSFRHTLATALHRAGVSERHIEQISGRSFGRSTTGWKTYIKDDELPTLLDAIRKVQFDDELTGVRPFSPTT